MSRKLASKCWRLSQGPHFLPEGCSIRESTRLQARLCVAVFAALPKTNAARWAKNWEVRGSRLRARLKCAQVKLDYAMNVGTTWVERQPRVFRRVYCLHGCVGSSKKIFCPIHNEKLKKGPVAMEMPICCSGVCVSPE